MAAAVMAASSVVAHAAEATAASPEQFANATSACFDALGAKEPSDVLKVLESGGWKIDRTTPIGGIFRRDGVAIQLKVETVVFSRICTVLGNRDGAVSLADSAQLIEASLKAEHGDGIKRDETGSNFTLIANEKYRAVISPAQSDRDFNTQITTIEI
ncbi:hypothetical protein [Sphingopyxis sp.]|uniref:hypothetical protein n=1 Tax=Sphingopyxis sp. TaxID=1908224 RepID=UPI0019CF17FD|nr:hypothetical protein [Sphingopyxis sp.]MBD3747285.1 hypothetical protein [Sphingopyxis terrae]